jgi:Tol biopolymer transport system component
MRKGHFLCIMVIALLASLACRSMSLSVTTPVSTATLPDTPGSVTAQAAPDYEVVSITTLTTDGGRVDWSHDGEWIYYDHLEPDGFWDVYRIHPDGTGNECITCDRPELPNRNQGQPEMHPDGRYLVFQAEKAEHVGRVGDTATSPGHGYYNDLWALDLETGSSHQLTDVRSGFPAGGSLHSHFSNDGTKLLWSDLERYDGRFGDWQLAVADFVTSPSPHLQNYRYYNPGPQPIWLEAHGWGPDNSWIYFTCTPVAGMDDNNQDICRMDFSHPTEVTRLTFTSGLSEQRSRGARERRSKGAEENAPLHLRTSAPLPIEPGEWDEHAHLSPLHDAFSWMSSTPYGTESTGPYGQWLRTEIWLMNVDGSDQRRMTFFNDTEDVIVADNDWNTAATGNQQLVATMFMRDRNETHIKIVEFSVRSPQHEVYLPLVVKG